MDMTKTKYEVGTDIIIRRINMIVPDELFIDKKALGRGQLVIYKEARYDKRGRPMTHKFVDVEIVPDLMRFKIEEAEDVGFDKGLNYGNMFPDQEGRTNEM